MGYCVKCMAELVDGAKFCSQCGQKVEQELKCKVCGEKLAYNAKFCFSCGSAVDTDYKSSVMQSTYMRQQNITVNKSGSDESWWGRIYGDSHYIEYKGCIYYAVSDAMLTGKKATNRGSNEWRIVRFNIEDREQETIRIVNTKYESGLSLCSSSSSLSYTIYNDMLYYWINDYKCITIYGIDVNTKEENAFVIPIREEDDIYGVFESSEGVVYIQYRYDSNSVWIVNREMTKKQNIAEGAITIEAYNNSYVYYTSDDGLYVVDLETFEVKYLSEMLTSMQKGEFYHVDPRRDIVYVEMKDAEKLTIFAIDLNNKIIEELTVPDLPGYVVLSDCYRDFWMSNMHLTENWSGPGGTVFFNGERWIINIHPMYVDTGRQMGLACFDKKGEITGSFMKVKEEANYFDLKDLHFMLPSALSVRDEANSYDWIDRMLYTVNGVISDSGVVFHYLMH